MKRLLLSLLISGLLSSCLLGQPNPKDIDEAQVRQLVRQLEDRERATRDQAEEKLRAMGAGILPLLPKIDDRTSGELKPRLMRIREQLEKQQVAVSAEKTHFTLDGKMTLSAALASIKKQTGNTIVDYRRQFNQESTDTEIEIDLKNVSFWEGLDSVLDEAGLTINNFVGESRKLAVIAKPPGALPRVGTAVYEGPFRVEAMNLFAERDLRNPQASTLRLGIEILWEPRILPILIEQNLEDVTLETDTGDTLALVSPSGTMQRPVEPGVSNIEFRFPLELPSRDVKEIKSFKGKFTALVPTGDVEFDFTDLVGARNVKKQKGGLTVVLDSVRKNGGVQQISIRVRFDKPGDALQSHLDWVGNNEVVLIDPNGTQVDEPNYEKYLERKNEVGYSYLFAVDNELKGYKLKYKTPAGIAEMPVEFELKNITLP